MEKNQINFAQFERYSALTQRKKDMRLVALLALCMGLAQALVVGYWYFNSARGTDHAQIPPFYPTLSRGGPVVSSSVQQVHIQESSSQQNLLEVLAPFLNGNKKLKLSSLHKQKMYPHSIVFNEQGMSLTVAIANTQSLQKSIDVLEKTLETPLAVQSIKEINNQRLVCLATELGKKLISKIN